MKLRIVEICTDKLPCPPRKGGAIETYVYGVSKALRKLGAEVHLVTIEKRSDVDYNDVHVHVVDLTSSIAIKLRRMFSIMSPANANIPYLTVKLLKLFKVIEDSYGEIDAIHTHYFTTSFAPLYHKYFKGRRGRVLTILHLHNELKPNNINKPLLNAYDYISAVSKYVKQRTVELLNVDPKKIGVVYNAVDTKFFKPCKSSEVVEKKKKFELIDNEFVITFVGRIVPEKGLHHLLLASKILLRKGYRFKLVVVGPLGHFDKESFEGYPKLCMELVRDLGISNVVKYLGRLNIYDLRDLYCASDLVVVPSLWEDPCPTVVLEAMAMGRPVAAYASGGIPELIPSWGGIVVRNKNPYQLAKAIENFTDGTMNVDANKLAAWTHRNFSYFAVARKLYGLLTKILNEVS